MNKRFLSLIVATSLLLTACGDDGSDSISCSEWYWNGEVAVCLPSDWITVSRETLRERGVDLPEEVMVAFESTESHSGQHPRVTVTRERLSRSYSGSDYSHLSRQSVMTLPGYEELDTRDTTVDGEQVSIHIFSLQPEASKPKQRFYQLSTVSGSDGYTLTGMAPLSIDDAVTEQMVLILKSVQFDEPSG